MLQWYSLFIYFLIHNTGV